MSLRCGRLAYEALAVVLTVCAMGGERVCYAPTLGNLHRNGHIA